ncbi:MAG TPA: hypothetical protein VGJ15_04525 [Pirellulales bacterium]
MDDKLELDVQYDEFSDEIECHMFRAVTPAPRSRAWQLGKRLEIDLLAWSRHFLPQHFCLPPSAMHRWLAEQLDGFNGSGGSSTAGANILNPEPRTLNPRIGIKLNVVGPRASAKSTVATLAFVLREALSRRQPYIWIVSDTKHQAAAHLENVKTELADNQALAKAYPEAAGVGPVWRSGAIVLRNGVMIEALGTGQRIRGRRRKQHRPTLIVCDDLQNDGHIQSALARDRSRSWFHGLIMKAGSKRTHVVNLGTALHRECLAMELNRTPGWISRVFRAIQQWPDDMPLWHAWEQVYCDVNGLVTKPPMVSAVERSGLSTRSSRPIPSAALCNDARQIAREFYQQHREQMDAGAVVLWPEQEDLYTLMCMRAESGSTAFEREKQSTPVNPELCEWPESYFGDWMWFDEWPEQRGQGAGDRAQGFCDAAACGLAGNYRGSAAKPQADSGNRLVVKVLALDPSKGADARHGDYSAFVMLGVGADGVLYIEADLARRPTPQIVTDGVELCRRFGPQVFGIESNQFQELLGADFAAELARQQMFGIAPYLIENRTSKAVRIRRLGPLLAARRLRFKARSPGTRMLVDQLREFPLASHDDGPDAAEMALRLAEEFLRPPPPSDGLGERLI